MDNKSFFRFYNTRQKNRYFQCFAVLLSRPKQPFKSLPKTFNSSSVNVIKHRPRSSRY